jgi:predicted regulator of Ras-like GTPase activity (Roadblock/LC7/MglB family)
MESHLLELLDYQDVLAAVASSRDGLLVSMVGLDDGDAEAVAAAGSALTVGSDEPAQSVALPSGELHVVLGKDLMVLTLTEPGVPRDALARLMRDTVEILDSLLAGEG